MDDEQIPGQMDIWECIANTESDDDGSDDE